ncbi:MAG TPA: hypothetical protein VIR54_32200 [Vicinamibacterales bacterium]|jgi:hypothetical protein
MAREPEDIEIALKRVDLSKRFILTTIVFVFIAILFTFGSLLAHARVGDDGRWKLQLVTTAAEMAFVGICAVLVSYHVSRMTRTVLNAIELLRK